MTQDNDSYTVTQKEVVIPPACCVHKILRQHFSKHINQPFHVVLHWERMVSTPRTIKFWRRQAI